MKIQQTVGDKYGKKYTKLYQLVTDLDNAIIGLGDACQNDSFASDFAKEYKRFTKLAAKLAALVGE